MDDDFLYESPLGPPMDERAVARARAILSGIPQDKLPDCLERLEYFLNARAAAIGYTRVPVQPSGMRWFPLAAAATTPPRRGTPAVAPAAPGSPPHNGSPPFDDVQGLATAFGPETETELTDFLTAVHPDWMLALTLVLAILVSRAADGNDAAAIERAEDIGLELLPRVTRLAWDRAAARAKQSEAGRAYGAKAHKDAKDPDSELREAADAAVQAGVPPHKLTTYLLERHGPRFGGARYLRDRLAENGYRNSRKTEQSS